ncbi:hypothetical protein [Paracoccus sp. NSM]|uniref:hypothetical protein n=1 Tax=Paracoccus sp. NSM TaxID=3457784 RepID=UPI0040350CD9
MWTAPFGNTGIDWTLGAGLAVLGSLATCILVLVLMREGLPSRWRLGLHVAALLAALLTAIAALFLMQTALMLLMIASAATLAIAGVAHRRRTLA